jgi:hypothetical protein
MRSSLCEPLNRRTTFDERILLKMNKIDELNRNHDCQMNIGFTLIVALIVDLLHADYEYNYSR